MCCLLDVLYVVCLIEATHCAWCVACIFARWLCTLGRCFICMACMCDVVFLLVATHSSFNGLHVLVDCAAHFASLVIG